LSVTGFKGLPKSKSGYKFSHADKLRGGDSVNIPASSTLTRVGQIAINVHDVDRATTFYREALALPLLFRAGQLSFFDCGGVRLMLSAAEKPEFNHPSSILYFHVADIHAAFHRLQSAGAKFEDQPHLIARMPTHDLWITTFRDSENNLLALMSEVVSAVSP
jgi:methylmalonyl-CoA/ethylmalonyl-CoA epimerase